MERLMELHLREHRVLSGDVRTFVDKLVRGEPPQAP
jgi:hypothetical protein